MQGLVHGRWSVRGHPNVRSKLDVIEHQNFLFDMERIHLYAAEMCNKFSILLDLEGCSGDCIGEGSQSSRWNLVKYPSSMKRVDIEDRTWSGGTELSLDRGQGYELL
ncbi:hypothetical protein B296_00005992 [Ensete ventricosum]|uniref:Uncharacterized protein n=1 Tax=Ensete ventricosum TaxID=4639 RepID=A0A426X094_ENSVE|nr:hypothetical protein B296_00005992 [Ensete ventricosum]